MTENTLAYAFANLGIHMQTLEADCTVTPGKDHHRTNFVMRGEIGKLATDEELTEFGMVACAKWSKVPAVQDLYNQLVEVIRITSDGQHSSSSGNN